ncbi:MAG: NmrA family NAD(P)-binding protein [Labilithrix sp.]|nr:NmrA family NAD(P)-binding protein [Labilithrix sp.]
MQVELVALGVELHAGDMNDRASLAGAFDGAYGVFSVQPSAGQPQHGVTAEDEVRLGKNVADVAVAARVEHVVYGSVDGCDRSESVPYLYSKWRIEEHLRSIGARAAFLRSQTFMENVLLPALGVARGQLTFFSPPDKPLPYIAAHDIGFFAAQAFASPRDFDGVVNVASDELSGNEVARADARDGADAPLRTVSEGGPRRISAVREGRGAEGDVFP